MATTTEMVLAAALKSGRAGRVVQLLLDSYQDEVLRYCIQLVGLRRAPLIFQRAVAAAIDNVTSIEQCVSIRAWLFRVTRAVVHSPAPEPPEPADPVADTAHPRGDPAESRAEARARDEGLERGLSALEPRVVEVLQLALWHELQLAEAAYVLGLTLRETRRMAAEGLNRLALEIPARLAVPS